MTKSITNLIRSITYLLVLLVIQGCSSEKDSQGIKESTSAYWQTVDNEPVIIDLLGDKHSIELNGDFHTLTFLGVDENGKTLNIQADGFDEIWKLTLEENEQNQPNLHLFIRDGVEGNLSYVMSLFDLEKQWKEQASKYQRMSLDDLKLDLSRLHETRVELVTTGYYVGGELLLQNNIDDLNAVNTDISKLGRDERKSILNGCSDIQNACDIVVFGEVDADYELVHVESVQINEKKSSNTNSPKTSTQTSVGAENVTLKDFQLGMSTADVESLFKSLGKTKESGWNNCSANTGSIKPFVQGLAPIESYLFDQACILWEYDLIGSTVDVTAIFHSDKLIWVEFNSRGGKTPKINKALNQALERKYGRPERFQYADLFGAEKGKQWLIGDAVIKMKSSSLTLESIKGRQAMKDREGNKNTKAGSVL